MSDEKESLEARFSLPARNPEPGWTLGKRPHPHSEKNLEIENLKRLLANISERLDRLKTI